MLTAQSDAGVTGHPTGPSEAGVLVFIVESAPQWFVCPCFHLIFWKIIMKKTVLLSSLLAAFVLTACGKQEEAPVAPAAPAVEQAAPAAAPVEPAAPAAAPADAAAAPADAAAAAAAVGAAAVAGAVDATKEIADKAAAAAAEAAKAAAAPKQ